MSKIWLNWELELNWDWLNRESTVFVKKNPDCCETTYTLFLHICMIMPSHLLPIKWPNLYIFKDCLKSCQDLDGCSYFTFLEDENACEAFSDCIDLSEDFCENCYSGPADCDGKYFIVKNKSSKHAWVHFHYVLPTFNILYHLHSFLYYMIYRTIDLQFSNTVCHPQILLNWKLTYLELRLILLKVVSDITLCTT